MRQLARGAMILLFLLGVPRWLLSAPTTLPAITYRHEIRQNPPLHVHVVIVDLADPRVHVRVRPSGADPDGDGPWACTLLPTTAVAQRDGLDVAVNGDFFIPKDKIKVLGRDVPYFPMNWARPCGLAISDGVEWSGPRKNWVAFAVDDHKRLFIGQMDAPPRNIRQAVGGSTHLVHFGKSTHPAGEDRAPRTAVGFDRAQTKLVLLVVDGRRAEYSVGMTLAELADEMVKLGCEEAMNLDGGGSSTMVMRDPKTAKPQVLNRPSDGHDFAVPLGVERSVANVLGVSVDGG